MYLDSDIEKQKQQKYQNGFIVHETVL